MTENIAGIFPGLTEAEYDALDGIRSTRLWTIYARTASRYRHECGSRKSIDEKEPLLIGRVLHCLVLQPERFDQHFVLPPPPPSGDRWNRRLKLHKEAWQAFKTEQAGRTLLTAEQLDLCQGMRDAVWAHADAAWLLKRAEKEVTLRWVDKHTTLSLKARIDGLIRAGGVLLDIKTCLSAQEDVFGWSAYAHGYHFRLAMYHDGAEFLLGHECNPPVIIAVEKDACYDVALYDLRSGDGRPDPLELGKQQYRHALSLVRKCLEAGEWPGYPPGIWPLKLPGRAGYETPGGAVPEPEADAEEDTADIGLI